ncbi:tripartite ATP-independent periplasmic transporter solute receptor, DctP family [Sphaerochaeta pleomorpha str. Grapes]|uniref:Tripartite ATP-independent periplasmic transporter solute receptor, DctP family n=1 Tax=Sphaerochaeta pleomorpha (strain ATCC BAA-1885 / DSM 22778 / Grapes) TaxID=158190 RepID=G8QUK3_SPHPG|nr:TRAP transporter substrate-binding protein [Sphaerochaeta pleomorpha]AEV29236.1 tripartite ATP-independent periplasmic transporter solute receptor, DctP family [Sphaerochaeta pleomorpha str. Grapes]
MLKKVMICLFVLSLAMVPMFANGSQEEKAPVQKNITMRLADNQPDGYPTVVGCKEFARLVKERTNGRITIEVYPSAQLGDAKSVIEQLQFGGIDFTRTSISPLASFSPELDILQMPYLYRDANHYWNVLNGEIGEYFLKSVEKDGFLGLVYVDAGSRSFYNTKKPIYTVADLKGMKIRVQESSLMMGMIKSLGAVPTALAYGDVYSALQTGVIDGAENNWPSYATSAHFEVAKFYSIDQHTRVPEMIVASKINMDKLSTDDQALIKKAAMDSQAVEIAAWAEFEKTSEAKVRAAGCQINTINDQAEFAAAMAPLYQDQLDEQGRIWVEKIKAVK